MYVYYRLLGVDETAGDKEIRRAYLDLVKKFPPEKHADQFKRITRAYEALKDKRARVRSRLLGTSGAYRVWSEALDDFLQTTAPRERRSPGLKDLVEAQQKDDGTH